VARGIDDHHRAVGGHAVEFFDRGRAVLLHLPRLVAEAHDPSPVGCPLRLLPHPREQVGDVGAAEDIGIDEVLTEVDEVAVGVDESGKKRLPSEVDRGRCRADEGLCLGERTDEHDLSILDGEGLGHLGLRPAHRDDVAAGVERVGDVSTRRGSGGERQN
jgi:hypothetical protein